MPKLYESELEARLEREFRPWRCVRIFLLRCSILFGELVILTALLYWANRAFGVASWLRVCTAIALFCWSGFAWTALKGLLDVYILTRWIRIMAKCLAVVTLLALIDVSLGITFPA